MPPPHSLRMTSIDSSMRAPRRSHGCSSRSNSSRIHPAPTPRPTRPPERCAAVPIAFAATNGLRAGSTYTLVMNRSRVVTAAIEPIATHASGQSSSGLNIGVPSGVYGYFERRFDGYTTWSDTATESNPASSHAFARRPQWRGSAPMSPWQNFTLVLPSPPACSRGRIVCGRSRVAVAQLVPDPLAARVERERGDDPDPPRHLEVRHVRAGTRDD